MNEPTLPSFAELNQALSQTSLKLHPSQVHGLIAGILCGNPNSTAAWEELVTGSEQTGAMHDLLQSLYNASAKQLADFLFEFEIVLPPDSDDLQPRAEALTLWCQGFLTGLKVSNVPIEHRDESELTEAINDLIEIAKMNYEEVVASEEDETAYVELVEYVRMAVILIYEDLRESEAPKKTTKISKHLH